MSESLPEIPVAGAPSEIADIYRKIMVLSGVGSPALIYRHFAYYDGLLQWVWKVAGPEMEDGSLLNTSASAAYSVPTVSLPSVSRQEMQSLGVDADGQKTIADMLATYNRMNPINLCLVSTLRNILLDVPPAPDDVPPDVPYRMPPAVDTPLPAPLNLDEMAPGLAKTLGELSAKIPSPGATVTPTLYRHLAIWPAFMQALAPGLADAIDRGEVEMRQQQVLDAMQPIIAGIQTRAAARDVGPPPIDDPTALAGRLETFLYMIPQLIVIGCALEVAIED